MSSRTGKAKDGQKRREVSLHYCSHCKSTTRHTETQASATCLRCGTVKTITRMLKPVAKGPAADDPFWN